MAATTHQLGSPLAAAAGTAGSAADEPPAALSEDIRSAFDYMPAILAGNLAGISVLTLLFSPAASLPTLLAWLLPSLSVWAWRIWLFRSFQHASPASITDWQRWRLLWNIGILASGALWGFSAWLFYPLGDSNQQTALIIVVYTFCVAAVPVLATQPRVYLLYAAMCFVPMAARVALVGDHYGAQLAAILLLIFSMTALLARNYRQALQRAIELKVQADRLLQQLRGEKQLAEDARRQAEVANRAKTQFFSAVSHDLRQPLHAMGLFAEALRHKAHDDEVVKLVNSINDSVDALESLFSELLDITRIDSGGVSVNPQPFEFDDILRRLRLHFEPVAFEKGLALRLRGGRHGIHADPLLVERILRNLVSNAIRYCADGTVLVSARRRGDKVLVQVWDTGPGIAEEEQQRIFEEFYQIAAADSADAGQQRKGLGLGLAIVRRLTDLIGAQLDLRSQPGRGTVFSLTLPLGRIVREPMPRPTPVAGTSVTLHGRTIVVVEDEPTVRAGLEVLLKEWGAAVASFDSVAAVTTWAGSQDPATTVDLLIVDYRLEQGLTGVDALRFLRQRFGVAVPAIVVTGSTMTGHENEAHDEDFHVLIKPVVPNKLRAMIAFKLGVRQR
ncbi:ATP-binding protein [Piscinibacter sakaiensis]|uniref:ATP-binding response regulator n=1 Tax=Piscinibacter sakaiensis TaxID=1547922 RepID=UPI003AB050C9